MLEGARALQQGSGFHENIRISASTDSEVTAHNHLVIVTAGVAQKPGECLTCLLPELFSTANATSLLFQLVSDAFKESRKTSFYLYRAPWALMACDGLLTRP